MADRIVVLEDGRVEEAGSHAELLSIGRIDMLDNGVGEPGNTLELSSLIEDFNGTWDSDWDSAAEDARSSRPPTWHVTS